MNKKHGVYNCDGWAKWRYKDPQGCEWSCDAGGDSQTVIYTVTTPAINNDAVWQYVYNYQNTKFGYQSALGGTGQTVSVSYPTPATSQSPCYPITVSTSQPQVDMQSMMYQQYLYWNNQNWNNQNAPMMLPVQWQDTPETAEQRAKLEAEYKAERERKAAAKVRAEKLLFTILTPSQVKTYSDDGYFEQEVNGRIYRLHANSVSKNVALMENGKAKIKFCAHPHDAYDTPIPDVLMSQLLMLRADEQSFLRIANRTVLQ